MLFCRARLATALLLLSALSTFGATNSTPSLTQVPWFETRSAHFHIFSCGKPQAVASLAGRLEQFQQAYSLLAGSQAVASPPIIVLAFPDHETLKPFLPLYQGQPANMAAFFRRGSDENLIVLSLDEEASGGLGTVFHEYTHLLLRHNALFWPLWLDEGMAELYSTFEVVGENRVRIAAPIDHHLGLLTNAALMPLHDLFGVGHGSPEYNERDRQGIFYAQSWLLTHYLAAGPYPENKTRLGHMSGFLREGQHPDEAFTNAFQIPLSAMETQLRRYLQGGKFTPIDLVVPTELRVARALSTRSLTPVEVLFRFGDELFRIDRYGSAESYFQQAQKLAPASPLAYEGLGLLALRKEQRQTGIAALQKSIQLGSTSYLAHYYYAAETYRLTSKDNHEFTAVEEPLAGKIRSEFLKSIVLMPDFGPAHHLLGFFEAVQRTNLVSAEKHLEIAVQLEPDNPDYLLSLAQAQLARGDTAAASRTLELLLRPYIQSSLRAEAQKLLDKLSRRNAP